MARTYTAGMIAQGLGVLLDDPRDFPRAERERIAVALDKANLPFDVEPLAYRICAAVEAPGYMLECLRAHLRTDGREMIAQVRTVARLVPDLQVLLDWL